MNANLAWSNALMLCVALFAQTAHAGLRPDMTPQEFKSMEPACQAIGMGELDGIFWAEAMKKPQYQHILDQPENAMARGAGWFHHYCWGKLGKLRYFSAKTQSERDFEIKRWRNNMEFIISWTSQHQIDWPYIHLIHKEIAESYLYEKKYLKAISEAESALQTDREYAGTYLLLADIYTEMKNRPKALEYVTDGLKYNPDSAPLQRRYKALGGKMPYPKPADRSLSNPVAPKTELASPPTAATTATEPSVQPPESEDGSADAGSNEQREQPADNPYCRFCP